MIKAYKYTRYSLPFDFHDPSYETTEIFIPDYEIIIYDLDRSYPCVISGNTPKSSINERISDLIEIKMTQEDVDLVRELDRIQKELSRIQKELGGLKKKYM